MVRHRKLLLLACMLPMGCTGSDSVIENGNASAVRERASMPAYTDVTVTTNGGWGNDVSGDETPKSCSTFRVMPSDVTTYFHTAAPVDSRAFSHDLDMSRCFAAGTVREGKRSLGWTLDRMGRGQLIEPNNRRRFFQCAHCPSPPFEEGAGDPIEE